MTTIGLVVRPGIKAAQILAGELVAWAKLRGFEMLLDSGTLAVVPQAGPAVAHEELVRRADPIVTLGGDGTLIGLARHIRGNSPAILGVNFGNLGFLTETTPAELFEALERVLAGSARIVERSMIVSRVRREGREIFQAQGLNDSVVQKEARARLLDIDLAVNGEAVMRLRADGLICSTPTGSTAYSLAAGGSIAHPGLEVMLVTPICAHSLTARPLILRLSDKLSVKIPEHEGTVVLTVDGQVSVALQSGDEVETERSAHRIRLVKSVSRSYFDILRTKLNWGIANKNE